MKYRLIKCYPGSLNIGEIVTKIERKGVITYENLDYAFSKDSIENYPEFWQKVEEKEVLFTCEDGVDLFKDNKYFIVDRNFLIDTRTAYLGNSSFTNKEYHSFSTKEKAEKYVLLNKPSLSYNEIIHCYNYSSESGVKFKDRILNKIKEKIKI